MADNVDTGAQVAPHIYYYSDPDEGDKLLHHLPIPSFIDLSKYIEQGKLWKVYNVDAPDKSMVDPVIELSQDGPHWVENDKNAQTALLAKAQKEIEGVENTQQQSAQQSLAVTKQLAATMKQNSGILKAMQAVQMTMASMNKTLASLQSAKTSDTQNGGTK